MKLLFCFLLSLCASMYAKSQYYYNDIIVLKETNRQYQALKTARITQVSAKSFESDGQPTAGFVLQQEVVSNTITTTSQVSTSAPSTSVNTYVNNRLVKTVDNSPNIISTANYVYDAAGNIQTITTVVTDTFMNTNSEEVHQWYYKDNSPSFMLRIKDKADTTIIEFAKDEQGNIAEEHWKKRNRRIENYFYYYNEAHLITDIVRYNLKAAKLLPDFLFEYNSNGLITQLTQIPQMSGAYLVWHYDYNANNLKEKESAFDRQRRPVGTIVYTYR